MSITLFRPCITDIRNNTINTNIIDELSLYNINRNIENYISYSGD